MPADACVWNSDQCFKGALMESSMRCETPNSLSAEAGRSFGTLDLSGASEALDASADSMSPKDGNTENNLSAMSATNVSMASTRYAHTGSPSRSRREPVDFPATPMMPMSSTLKMSLSHGTPHRTSEEAATHLRDGDLSARSNFTPTRSNESPLHPLRLFNPPQQPTPHAPVSAANEGSAAAHRAAHPAFGAALQSFRPNQGGAVNSRRTDQFHTRHNPFLGVGAISCSPHEHSRFSLQRTLRLTLRSFHHDFFEFEEIGKGSHGKVFKCHRKIDLCPYAVKEIPTGACSVKRRECLLREIYAHSSQADNVHVVRYYNAWEQDETLYIQMELCSGTLKTLREKEGPFQEDQLADVLLQTASGLAYMHAHNQAHMDLKPENMFWTERGIYKLGDFGLVTVADAGQHFDDGDKVYLSREMLMHDFCDLRKGDIFALGMSMYELASGSPIPSTGDAYHAMRDGQVPRLPAEISDEMFSLIASMLHPNPSERPSAADIVRHPMLFPRLRPESAACLRTQPSPIKVETAAANQGDMIRTHLRALDAEKKVMQLEASLKEAQDQLMLYKECIQGALKGNRPSNAMACEEIQRLCSPAGRQLPTVKALF